MLDLAPVLVKKILMKTIYNQIMSHIDPILRRETPAAFWRLAFWLGTTTVTVLSLLPQSALPPLPDISDKIEHAGAYLALAAIAGPVWPRMVEHGRTAVTLMLLGGAIEIAQLWVPGRSAEWGDFAADMIGVLLGVAAFRLAAHRRAGV